MLFCNYLGCIFTLLEFNKFYLFTKNLYFIPPLILFSLYFFLRNYLKGKITSRRPQSQGQDIAKAQTQSQPQAQEEAKKNQ
jgi:hypothetical protein